MLRGAYDILETVQEHLGGLHIGDTTKDGKFTLVEVECLGACSNAPMMAVNDDFYVRSHLFFLFPSPSVFTDCCSSGGFEPRND
jgi:hypothetical protein